MHILLIHQAFASLKEGGGTRHVELSQFLVQRGHRVTIITSPVSYLTGKSSREKNRWIEKEQFLPGIEIIRAYTYPALHRSFFHRLINFFSFMISSFLAGQNVSGVDLVWGTTPPIFQSVTAWLLARLKGRPFLLEIRDLWPKFAVDLGVIKNPLLIRASLWLEKFLYHRADQLIVNSPGYVDHVKERGGKKVSLIPNGVDPTMFDPAETGLAFRQELGLEDRFIILYAGAHGLANNLDMVLQAAGDLRDEPRICFMMVGDGKEKAHLIETARQMNLPNVVFLPAMPKEKMAQVMGAADACLASLQPIESFKTTYPNKVFDYMAAGRPVLLAIDGVIRQVVDAAAAGVFVQPGSPSALAQAVRQLFADPAAAKQMGLSGRQYVEKHFDRASLADQLAQLLELMRKKP
ncbi:MAG: glycosyltransferase family 4 protein [Chloroflexi bacterium]|nr:glycosyltransferase family 4 protein [Chloroflexota bacterium]